jgi:hypothetical protein
MTDNSTETKPAGKAPSHVAWHVRDSGNGKGYWNRVGVAWTNKDGGFTVQLDSVPLDGRIVCQPADKADKKGN